MNFSIFAILVRLFDFFYGIATMQAMRFLGIHLASIAILIFSAAVLFFANKTSVDATEFIPFLLSSFPQSIKTESRFSERVEVRTEAIPFQTLFEDDPNQEIGIEIIEKKGIPGQKEIIIRILDYDGKEYSRSYQEKITKNPSNQLIIRGSKITYQSLDTEYGAFLYSRVFRDVWASSYDATCQGCDEITATGMKQGYGVVAVDPALIPLGSRLFIPGYGVAVAGDTGGSIKGKRIDLGFDSLDGQWSAKYVDVYLLKD